MNKELRKRIFNKYNGHCAYCGTPIPISKMQVDHLQPKWHNLTDEDCERKGIERGTDDEDNLMPSCRACNYYKHTSTLDGFRARLALLQSNVMESFNARLALKYQMIALQPWDGKFYFERPKDAEPESPDQNADFETNVDESANTNVNNNLESENETDSKI